MDGQMTRDDWMDRCIIALKGWIEERWIIERINGLKVRMD